jgi:chromosome partitioning protein
VIISFFGEKGGTGKSTLTICIAVELQVRGRSVLIIDADEQGTASVWRETARQHERPAPDLLRAITCEKLEATVQGNFDKYDFVLIDLPSHVKEVPRAGLILSDVVLTPCAPSATEMWSLTTTVDVIKEAQTKKPELRAYAIQTKVQMNTRAGRSFREDLEPWGITQLFTHTSHRVAYKDAIAAGCGVTNFPNAGPAAPEMEELVDELVRWISRRDRNDETDEDTA